MRWNWRFTAQHNYGWLSDGNCSANPCSCLAIRFRVGIARLVPPQTICLVQTKTIYKAPPSAGFFLPAECPLMADSGRSLGRFIVRSERLLSTQSGHSYSQHRLYGLPQNRLLRIGEACLFDIIIALTRCGLNDLCLPCNLAATLKTCTWMGCCQGLS